MPSPGQTGRRRRGVVFNLSVRLSSIRLCVCLFVCYQTCTHDMSEPVLMPTGTSGPETRCEMINFGDQEVKVCT